jgi:ATP synthase protein I
VTKPNDSNSEKNKNRLQAYARFSGIAFEMIAIIGLGTYGGMKLDEAYPNSYSLFTIICSLLSVGIAMYVVIKQVSTDSKKDND